MSSISIQPFAPDAMRARRAAYFRFVRGKAPLFFDADGTYRLHIDPDGRIAFWIFPALIDTDDPAEREFALRVLQASTCWKGWNIFTTSSIASICVREQARLTPTLRQWCEEHLDRFACVDGGRQPSSCANDYMFHGYNDNMPAMATRTLVLAGDVLDRADLTDRGLFFLETLGAHFERRGLLSEYASSTYTPITLTALMDVAELTTNAEAAELAAACANRILLDVFCHWHPLLGTPTGAASRAYLADATVTLTNTNALMWYLTGSPRALDPIDALTEPLYGGPIHHGPDPAFCHAQFCEFFVPDYTRVRPAVGAFAGLERCFPFEVRATTDAGRTAEIRTLDVQHRLWSLGTASKEMWAESAGQHLTCRAVIARHSPPRTWRDRVGMWHVLQEGTHELAAPESSYNGTTYMAQHVLDHGRSHTAQIHGTAMILGHLGTRLDNRVVDRLKWVFAFSTWGRAPDDVAIDATAVEQWDGQAVSATWHFLRFGDVYIGLRPAGMLNGRALPVRRTVHNGFHCIEVPIIEGTPTRVDGEFRKWLDLAGVLEIADAGEAGDFDSFRRQCLACEWQCFHCFYRNSRYRGRHGELQIVDSIEPDDIRFTAIDGRLATAPKFEATGLDPSALELLPDGRTVRRRSIVYDPGFVGTPFYDTMNEHVLCFDVSS